MQGDVAVDDPALLVAEHQFHDRAVAPELPEREASGQGHGGREDHRRTGTPSLNWKQASPETYTVS
jgi:hypothetical protein